MRFFILCLVFAVAEGSNKNAKSVCYGVYGCFSNAYPFDHASRKLPQSPSVIGTKFYLYTRKSLTSPQIITPFSLNSIRKSNFVACKRTVILAHGWTGSIKGAWIKPMVSSLLKREDMNVILTEWSAGALQPYAQATGNTRLVGKQISHLVERLHKSFQLKFSNVHLIGFSLGAHLVGFAGKYLRKHRHLVRRITGLDPASPGFTGFPTGARLCKKDARFVDVIHTSTAKNVWKNGLWFRMGIPERSGHMDFYPNGGAAQRGCGNSSSPKFPSCNHQRAVQYFIESINSNCPFTSYPCSSYSSFIKGHCKRCPSGGCPQLGYDADVHPRSIRRRMFLLIGSKAPFCVYQYMVSFITGGGITSSLKVKISGSRASTVEISLPRRTYRRRRIESFVIGSSRNLGTLKQIKVTISKATKGLYLKKVMLRTLWRRENTYTAYFHKWMKNGACAIKSFQ